MKLVTGVVAALLVAAVVPSRAAQDWAFPAATVDFVAKCKHERARCGAALKDMHTRDAVMSAIATHYCVPASLSAQGRVTRVLAWLRRHRDLAGGPARESLLSASKALWPCRGTRYVVPFPCGDVPGPTVQNRACDGGPATTR